MVPFAKTSQAQFSGKSQSASGYAVSAPNSAQMGLIYSLYLKKFARGISAVGELCAMVAQHFFAVETVSGSGFGQFSQFLFGVFGLQVWCL